MWGVIPFHGDRIDLSPRAMCPVFIFNLGGQKCRVFRVHLSAEECEQREVGGWESIGDIHTIEQGRER
jgi:hypothetical protein